MSFFGERALKIRHDAKMSQEAFAQLIGASSKQTVSNVELGKQKEYSEDQINKIIDTFGIRRAWLILGEGEMLGSEQSNPTQVLVDTDKFISIPIVTAKASGSPVGEIPYEVIERGEVSIAKMLFKTMPNIENVQAVEVIGNSMSPRINPGDYVIIDKMRHFDHDGVYVMQFDSMLLVKRLQVTTKGIKIISDNRMYDEDFYDPENDQRLMNIVGKVILVINRDMASF